MANDQQSSSNNERRVVSFRRGPASVRQTVAEPPPVDDLAKYERDETPDDYHQRMIVNVIAFVFIVGLIGGGIWVADTMAKMRKDQDCALSGRRGCSPIEVEHKDRW